MVIKSPVLITTPPNDAQRERHRSACKAIMRALGIRSADGVNHDSAAGWSNTFYGDVPRPAALLATAEAEGYDVVWGIGVHADEGWYTSFLAVEARDPAYVERLRVEYEDALAARAPDTEKARRFLAEERAARSAAGVTG